jgi:IS605 OrfB family transposase
MLPDGTVIGRLIFKLPIEEDHLRKQINYIKKAQQNGNYRNPRLWAYAKNINHDISCKTAAAIMEFAEKYNADVIVFEHLDFKGRKRGSKKQRLHLWRKMEVQNIVTLHAHQAGKRISTVCAWNTSRIAFDGSGRVQRGGLNGDNYSLCVFPSGKQYHADLNAAYNIGARYFIREILKSLSATVKLDIEAKVPSVSKRTTCGLSDLINLNAELVA